MMSLKLQPKQPILVGLQEQDEIGFIYRNTYGGHHTLQHLARLFLYLTCGIAIVTMANLIVFETASARFHAYQRSLPTSVQSDNRKAQWNSKYIFFSSSHLTLHSSRDTSHVLPESKQSMSAEVEEELSFLQESSDSRDGGNIRFQLMPVLHTENITTIVKHIPTDEKQSHPRINASDAPFTAMPIFDSPAIPVYAMKPTASSTYFTDFSASRWDKPEVTSVPPAHFHHSPEAVQSEVLLRANHLFKAHPVSGQGILTWNYKIVDQTFNLRQIPPSAAIEMGSKYTEWDKGRSREALKQPTYTSASASVDFDRIKQIWIWGERCSCTTAVTDLILKNFNLRCELLSAKEGPINLGNTFELGNNVNNKKCVIGGLPWKHDFMRRADLENKDETLHILVTRHPYEWLESFRRNAFYATIHKNLDMEKFLTLEWLSFDLEPDRQNRLESYLRRHPPAMTYSGPDSMASQQRRLHTISSSATKDLSSQYQTDSWNLRQARGIRSHLSHHTWGARWPPSFDSNPYPSLTGVREMTKDRDPDTGERFPTVNAMREAKLRDWLSVSGKLPFKEHIACRDFMLDPNGMLDHLHKKFKLQKIPEANNEWNLGVCVWRFGVCVSHSNHMQDPEQIAKRGRYLEGKHMKAFNDNTLKIANAWLDPELEAKFGYRLFNTIEEASVPYTIANRCQVHGSCV